MRHALRPHRLLAAAACAATLAACDDATAPANDAQTRQPGVLQFELMGAGTAPVPRTADGDASSGVVRWSRPVEAGTITAPRVIEVADTVPVGQPVAIVVNTVLPDGCWRTDGEDVRQSGLTVDITPQDARSDAEVCTMIYGYGAHRVTATFATRGTATVRVTGRRVRQGDATRTETITAERTVVVR